MEIRAREFINRESNVVNERVFRTFRPVVTALQTLTLINPPRTTILCKLFTYNDADAPAAGPATATGGLGAIELSINPKLLRSFSSAKSRTNPPKLLRFQRLPLTRMVAARPRCSVFGSAVPGQLPALRR